MAKVNSLYLRCTVSILLVVCLGLKGYDKLVDGFYLYRIFPSKDLSFDKTLKDQGDYMPMAIMVLDQPYHYLASGSQSFVFISEDRQYILKFFKHHRWKTLKLLEKTPLPRGVYDRFVQKRQEGLTATYQSCYSSLTYFQQATALIYLQLIPNHFFNQQVVLYDRLGRAHHVDLALTSFALQYYATPMKARLMELKHSHEDRRAETLIASLFEHLLLENRLGFIDKDPNFLNNFGFINDRAVSLDIGGLIQDPNKDNLYFCRHKLKKVMKTLLPWLTKNYPELIPFTLSKVQSIEQELMQSK